MQVLDWSLHPTKGHDAFYFLVTKAITHGQLQAREEQGRGSDGQEGFGDLAGPEYSAETGTG